VTVLTGLTYRHEGGNGASRFTVANREGNPVAAETARFVWLIRFVLFFWFIWFIG